MCDFNQLVAAIGKGGCPVRLPAVSFLKAPGYQDGHAAYSDPLDEQRFVVNTINSLEKSTDWESTAVIINYDDSDGWYDHAYSGVTNPSSSVADVLTGHRECDSGTPLTGEQRPVRLQPAAAAAGHLAVDEAELRLQHADQPDLDHQVHRGQLGPATDPRLLRQPHRQPQRHVQLQGARHRISRRTASRSSSARSPATELVVGASAGSRQRSRAWVARHSPRGPGT